MREVLTIASLWALIHSQGVPAELDRIMVAAPLVEAPVRNQQGVVIGANPGAVGDGGTSLGLYQMNDIHGLSAALRLDPIRATAWMFQHEYKLAFTEGRAKGYTDERLATWTYMRAERPSGWQGPSAWGEHSAAGERFAVAWRALGEGVGAPVATAQALMDELEVHSGTDYVFGAKGPDTFDCSGLLTYSAQQVGLEWGDPNYTSADSLRALGPWVPWGGEQPGDVVLFHSTYGDGGADYATHCGVVLGEGRMFDTHEPRGAGVTTYQTAYWQQHFLCFVRPSYADSAAEEEPAPAPAEDPLGALISRLGYLQGDVADAVESGIRGAFNALLAADSGTARVRRLNLATAHDQLDAALAAVQTLRTEGKTRSAAA